MLSKIFHSIITYFFCNKIYNCYIHLTLIKRYIEENAEFLHLLGNQNDITQKDDENSDGIDNLLDISITYYFFLYSNHNSLTKSYFKHLKHEM